MKDEIEQLKVDKLNLEKKVQRRVVKLDPGEFVYVYKESDTKFKIGETMDLTSRMNAYKTGSYSNELVYKKRCCNRKLLERMVHHILDEYRSNPMREFFDVTQDIVIAAIDSAHLFLDGIVNRCAEIHTSNFPLKLKKLIDECLPEEPAVKKEKAPPKPEETPSAKVPIFKLDDTTKDPMDFDLFIKECTIPDPDATVQKVALNGAYFLWSRSNNKMTKDALFLYMKKRFKCPKVMDVKTESMLASYKGFKLAPLTYAKDIPQGPDNKQSDIDQFIDEECIVSYTGRAFTKSVYTSFEDWKKVTFNADYIMNADEKSRVNTAFSMKFVNSKVFNGIAGVYGYFGVSLKNEQVTVGLKLAPSMKKVIEKVDVKTKEVLETYSSLCWAASVLKTTPGQLSTAIHSIQKDLWRLYFAIQGLCLVSRRPEFRVHQSSSN